MPKAKRIWDIKANTIINPNDIEGEFKNIQDSMNGLDHVNLDTFAKLPGNIFRDASCDSRSVEFTEHINYLNTTPHALTNAFADVPGATFTITSVVPAQVFVIIQCQFTDLTATTDEGIAKVLFGGSDAVSGGQAILNNQNASSLTSVCHQIYLEELVAGISTVIKMQAKSTTGAGNLVTGASGNGTFIYAWVFPI